MPGCGWLRHAPRATTCTYLVAALVGSAACRRSGEERADGGAAAPPSVSSSAGSEARRAPPPSASRAAPEQRGATTPSSDAERADAARAPSPELGPEHPLTLREPGGVEVPAARARRLLHVGDSMVPLVANYLRSLYFRDGRRYEVVSIPSATTLDFARRGTLREAMYRFDPEVVLISLGSNELYDPTPESRAASIRQIVAETRGRPCAWLSPPVWKTERGFLSVLRANLGHCRYFASERLKLARMEDGRHPTWSASHHWASEVWKSLGGTGEVPTQAR